MEGTQAVCEEWDRAEYCPRDVGGVENQDPTGKGEEEEAVAVVAEMTLTSACVLGTTGEP